jgi:hypothetical protein
MYNHPTESDISLLTKEYKYAATLYHTFNDFSPAEFKKTELTTRVKTLLKELNADDTVKSEILEQFSKELIPMSAHGASYAVFISPEFVKIFNVPNRLNSDTKIGNRFDISNLLRAESFPQEGYALFVNKDKWSLYYGTKTEPAKRVTIEHDETASIASMGDKEDTVGHTLQQYSHKEAVKAYSLRYAKKVATTVKKIVKDYPTIVFADTSVVGELRKNLTAKNFLFTDKNIHPDVDEHIVEHLMRKDMEVFNQKIIDGMMAQAEKLEKSDLTASDLTDIIHAAVDSKVDTLIISRDWDETADYVNGAVTFDTDESVVPFLIDTVLKYGGKITVVHNHEMEAYDFKGILIFKRFG